MTPSDEALLHIALLQCLKAVGDRGRPEAILLNDARMAGFDLTLPEFQAHVRKLADRNWITRLELPLAGQRWRLTNLGESKLAESGA